MSSLPPQVQRVASHFERKGHQQRGPCVLKKPTEARPSLGREKSVDCPPSGASRAHAHKGVPRKGASFRQNSATESTDSLELYVPEAQTRL
uniref:Uncharacterized protein n=1 Tax=Knipowitschia caucasica TaxID=637954 RepID=A0AAV2M5D0_KNICA